MMQWTDELDQYILDAKAAGQHGKQIARDMTAKFKRPFTESQVRSRWGRLYKRGDGEGGVDIPIEVEEEPVTSRSLPDEKKEEALIQTLVKLTKNGLSLEELCDKMDLAPRRIRDLVESAQERGFIVDIAQTHVGHRPADPAREITVPIQRAKERRIFGIMSDIHVGSKWFLQDQFIDFVHRAYDAGVRTMVSPGDLIDGNYKFLRWEQTHHGFYEQCNEFARILPRLPGLSYWTIGGNHDESGAEGSGIDIPQAMTEIFRSHGRDDFHMIGVRGGKIRLAAEESERGLIVELWHPKGGGAYALSYKLQKKIEGMAVGHKPDVLAMGHFHQHCYFTQRGVHAISSGTFHGGQSPFGLSLGTAPAIGGWIVRYAQTEDGTVRHFQPEWIAYYESEHLRSTIG
jgi:predicted phosphodiesterase